MASIPEIRELYNGVMDTVEIDAGSSPYGFAQTRQRPYPYIFPASTTMLSTTTQRDRATGGLTENGREFIHTIYVDFSGQDEAALEELELLIEAVETAVRRLGPDDLELPGGGHIERFEIDGSIRPGDGELPNARVAFKEWIVTAITEEI